MVSRNDESEQSVRLDQWLHAARFFKTRGLAAQAVKSGKVLLDESKAKPATPVRIGALLHVQRGDELLELGVEGLSTRRGSATVAQTLYTETTESLKRRQQQKESRKWTTFHAPSPLKRPDKKSRRQLIDLHRGKK